MSTKLPRQCISCALLVLFIQACSTTPTTNVTTDPSTAEAIDSASAVAKNEPLPESLLFKDNETFFKALVEKKFVAGELIDISFITDDLMSIDGEEFVKLSVALIKSGEGTYSGARSDVQYATVHCLLVAFKWVNDEQVFRDFVALGDIESQGLISGDIEAEEVKIAGDKTAVMIHFKSSEEGAGDYGFRKDDASVYVFVKNKLTSVLETTLDDFEFSSDEQGSYSERTTSTEFKVLDSQTGGMNDISILTVTSISVTGEEEVQDPAAEDDAEDATGAVIYKWNGNRYVATKD